MSQRGASDRGSGGRTGTVMCHNGVGLAQHDDVIISSTCLSLRTCSTSSVSNNTYMFKNIWGCLEEERLTVVTNGGKNVFNEIGEYELFPWQTSLRLGMWPMYLESKSQWIAQRSVQLQWSINKKL